MTEPSLTAAVFGPTGLIGRGVVRAWLGDPRVREVRAIARRPLGFGAPRLREIECRDFASLAGIGETLRGVDALCFCLGVPWTKARDIEEYRAITQGFALAAARALLAASPHATFHFVSGQLTHPNSWMAWARIKGQTEVALARLGLGCVIAWRPALIRDAEAGAAPSSLRLLRTLRLDRVLSASNEAVGEAMLQATFERQRGGVIENWELRALADRYAAARAG